MKNKNTVTIALVLAVAVTAFAFGSQSPITDKLFSIEQKANAQSSQIPAHTLYDYVFRLVISFKTKAESQQTNGEPVTAFATYFKEKVQLTDQENEVLQQVAGEFMQEVQPIDNEAEELIEELRKTSPDGFIEPPPELISLQEQRNDTALIYRNRLDRSLGSVKFGEFDNFVQGEFSSGIQTFSLPSE